MPQVDVGGYVLERDADVARSGPGTHQKAEARRSGCWFFAKAPGLKMVFRRARIGTRFRHGLSRAEGNRMYYVLSGRSMMTINDESFEVTPATAC